MDAFHQAYRVKVQNGLKCPKCPAANRPGATYIELDESGTRAYCSVCSASGPLDAFTRKQEGPPAA